MKRSTVTGAPRSSVRLWPGIIAFVVVVLVGLAGLSQAERIHDWFRLRDFQPSSEIEQIVQQTSMTDRGRHLFYINHPRLEDKQAFRDNCPEYEATIVLGCYRHGQGGIHVLKVDDPRLEGIEQVTAAHEMLHAAYDRLKGVDRDKINKLLETYAVEQLDDARILETIKDYERTEPGERLNEIHSIFGTEIASLPDELEQYYSRYFYDRQSVVSLASQYQEAFSSRQAQVKEYDARLADMNRRVKSGTEALAVQRESLSASERELDSLRDSGDFARYNAGVIEYNQAVSDYNQLLEQTKALIEEYNRIVEERNAIAVQTVELQQAIDSSAIPMNQ